MRYCTKVYLRGHQNCNKSRSKVPKKAYFMKWTWICKSLTACISDVPWDKTSCSTSFERSHKFLKHIWLAGAWQYFYITKNSCENTNSTSYRANVVFYFSQWCNIARMGAFERFKEGTVCSDRITIWGGHFGKVSWRSGKLFLLMLQISSSCFRDMINGVYFTTCNLKWVNELQHEILSQPGVNKMYYSVMNITEQIAKNWPFSEQLSIKSMRETSTYTKDIVLIL